MVWREKNESRSLSGKWDLTFTHQVPMVDVQEFLVENETGRLVPTVIRGDTYVVPDKWCPMAGNILFFRRTQTHHEFHSSPPIATTSKPKRRATKYVRRVRPYSPSSIDPGFKLCGNRPSTALAMNKNDERYTHRHTN